MRQDNKTVSPSRPGPGRVWLGKPRSRAPAPLTSTSFRVNGPLLGYRASVRRAFDPKYKAYKEAVALLALAAGFRRAGMRAALSVGIYWRKKPRIDWTNVVKAIEDALWPQDRNVDPGVFAVMRGAGEEYAQVFIEEWA